MIGFKTIAATLTFISCIAASHAAETPTVEKTPQTSAASIIIENDKIEFMYEKDLADVEGARSPLIYFGHNFVMKCFGRHLTYCRATRM
jgi:hypothetical protein